MYESEELFLQKKFSYYSHLYSKRTNIIKM